MAQRKAHDSAVPDVQPHIHRARAELKTFIDANRLLPEDPVMTIDGGLLTISLSRPINLDEMRHLSYLFAADPDVTRAKHEARDIKRRQTGGEAYTEPEDRVKLSGFSVLARTTKMGAYSFNLPAGPTGPSSLGTCRVSAKHWPIGQYQSDVAVNELGEQGIAKRDAKDWICSNCYAMKGAYGSPTVILIQELRRQWVASFADRADGSHQLATWLTRAIRWGQLSSIKAKASLAGKLDKSGNDRSVMVPNPGYFRIHDAGDFGLGPWYADAWFETCSRCAEPHVVRLPKKGSSDGLPPEFIDTHGDVQGVEHTLPAVRFWAATRAWTVNSGLEQYVRGVCSAKQEDFCVPENLSLRPSALYFGDAPPVLNGKHLTVFGQQAVLVGGYAQGTTADTLDRAKPETWSCPAYKPTDPSKPKKSQPGACQKSVGPDGEKPAPEGPGCRACWDHSDKPVTYVRH